MFTSPTSPAERLIFVAPWQARSRLDFPAENGETFRAYDAVIGEVVDLFASKF